MHTLHTAPASTSTSTTPAGTGVRTLDAAFRDTATRRPDDVFLRRVRRLDDRLDDRLVIELVTHGAAAVQVARTVRQLRASGFDSSDTIVVYSDDVSESLWFLLACFHLGVVPVPVAPSFSASYAGGIAARADATAVFALPHDAARLETARADPRRPGRPRSGTRRPG